MEKPTEVDYLKSIIKDKIHLISLLFDKIQLLENKCSLMTNSLPSNNSVGDKRCDMTQGESSATVNSQNHKQNVKKSIKNSNLQQDIKTDKIDIKTQCQSYATAVSNKQRELISEHKQTAKDSCVNQNTGKPNNSNSNWTIKASRRRTNKKTSIQGSNESVQDIRGVPKSENLYITRLQPDLTEEMLQKFLEKNNFQNIQCKKMPSKLPDVYSSFKITVDADKLDAICDGKIWPSGVTIGKFFLHLDKLRERFKEAEDKQKV
ncbi:hypothetical protein RI129_004575 [Pyrocoelia pectoralis]|uniref:Uncharacterized protein n=1 Tax=Pyrocoelia pectoralis TaxID=417401 RepID=A0AAN7VJK0_9COLE